MTNPQIQFRLLPAHGYSDSLSPKPSLAPIDADIMLANYSSLVNTLTATQMATELGGLQNPCFSHNATSFTPQSIARTFLLIPFLGVGMGDTLVQNQGGAHVWIAFGQAILPLGGNYTLSSTPSSNFVPTLPPISALPIIPNSPGALAVGPGQSVLLTTNQAVLAATQNSLVIGGGIAAAAQAALTSYGFVSAISSGPSGGSVIIASGLAELVYNF